MQAACSSKTSAGFYQRHGVTSRYKAVGTQIQTISYVSRPSQEPVHRQEKPLCEDLRFFATKLTRIHATPREFPYACTASLLQYRPMSLQTTFEGKKNTYLYTKCFIASRICFRIHLNNFSVLLNLCSCISPQFDYYWFTCSSYREEVKNLWLVLCVWSTIQASSGHNKLLPTTLALRSSIFVNLFHHSYV
jgi:hypothetical protein